METRQGANNETVGPPPGDETLVGTQLQVISQLTNDGRALESKFQITSAVGLEPGDGKRLFDAFFGGDTGTAATIISNAARSDPRFASVLEAAEATFAAAKDAVPVPTDNLGRDGFPNLRLIFDFVKGGPTVTFQTHTILSFTSSGNAQDVLDVLPGRNADDIVDAVTQNCVIIDSKHLEGMLRSALS